MKYQNNKDLAEAQYYLKMLDDFCKSGQVKIPEPTDTAMPARCREENEGEHPSRKRQITGASGASR